MSDSQPTYEDYVFTDLEKYAGIDAIVTLDLLRELIPSVVEQPSYQLVDDKGITTSSNAPAVIDMMENFAMKAYDYLIDLELTGMAYDIPENRRIAKRMVEEVAGLEESIFSGMGKRINLDSGTEVGQYLYIEKGFKAPMQTKSGDDAVDGAAMLTLAGLDPRANSYVAKDESLQWLCDMAKRRDIVSTYRTFVETYPEDWVKSDGRIHPQYNMVGTSGGRVAGEYPNVLQLPRPKHGYNIRDCYVVEPQEIFISADFSSCEVKIAGALSKDKNMLKAIEQGLDFHSASASSMLGIPYLEFIHMVEDRTHEKYKWAKHWRQVAKILTFSLIYGSSVNGIAMQLGMEKSEVERIMKLYFETYSGLEAFINSAHSMAVKNKYVVTPFGRRKQEFGCHDVFKYTAAYNACLRNSSNVLVQSTASDLGLIVFTHLNDAIKAIEGKSLACVYDSSENSAPIPRAAEAVEMMFYYMNDFPVEHFDWLDLPVGCDVEIGTRWGNLKGVHRGITQPEIEAILATMK